MPRQPASTLDQTSTCVPVMKATVETDMSVWPSTPVRPRGVAAPLTPPTASMMDQGSLTVSVCLVLTTWWMVSAVWQMPAGQIPATKMPTAPPWHREDLNAPVSRVTLVTVKFVMETSCSV